MDFNAAFCVQSTSLQWPGFTPGLPSCMRCRAELGLGHALPKHVEMSTIAAAWVLWVFIT